MREACAVSVVLCTYNRAALLPRAIERLIGQISGTPPYEVVLVDNNSADDTRAIIERYAASSAGLVRYVFEPRQGLSFARNAGIDAARSDIVAFTDDDVSVVDNWVTVVHRTFDENPEIECLGGRILPIWPFTPPAWLTRLHWVGPLALQDYGDQPFTVDAHRPVCVAGANFAFRKSVFSRLGLFSPEFPRSEDTEFMLRLWRTGAGALYVPEMKTYALVQPERLTKAYHRQWHSNIGRCNARMTLAELTAPDGSLRSSYPAVVRVWGVPRFAVRQLASEALWWVVAKARRREAQAFWRETQIRQLIGYMKESRTRTLQWRRETAGASHDGSAGPEVLK